MKKNMINNVSLAGRLFKADLKTFTVKKEGPNFGTEFIKGDLYIATDEEMLNVIPVSYVYEVPKTKSGKDNSKYVMLHKIMTADPMPTVEKVGKDAAMMLTITNATIVTDDWYSTKQEKEGSTVKVQSGFINEVTSLPDDPAKINEFCEDVVFDSMKRIEADEEKGIESPSLQINGYVFNFRGEISPVTFTLRDPDGIDYMEGIGFSKREPFFTKIWGNIINSTIKIAHEEETAWGGPPKVTYTEKVNREWLITNMRAGYEFDTEDTITMEELKKALQDREVHLAEVRKAAEEYAASKADGAGPMIGGGSKATVPVNKSAFKDF